MKNKKILFSILLICCLFVSLFLASCGDNSDDSIFYKEPEKSGPQFLEGSLTEVALGDTIILNEFIEYVDNASYKILLTDLSGNELLDLTSRATWNPEEPGEYYLDYTIDSGSKKGNNKHKIVVKTPELKWSYSIQNKPYNFGDVIVFADYFDKMNIYADSYYPWKVQMDTIVYGDKIVDAKSLTEYEITSTKEHTLNFFIETEDGQRLDAREVISIKNIDHNYYDTLKQELNISAYNELNVVDGEFTLLKGQYANGSLVWLNGSATPHDLPYIVYDGNYGLGSYFQVDFTGNNMPLVSFFRDDNYSKSIFDKTKGMMFSGGVSNNKGGYFTEYMCSCFTLYGPNMVYLLDSDSQKITLEDGTKVKGKDTDVSTRLRSMGEGAGKVFPGTMASLVDGKQYRLVCGFSHLSDNEQYLYFKCMVVDLDNRDILCNFTIETWNLDSLIADCLDTEKFDIYKESANKKAHLNSENYFNGKIVVYGNYGMTTTFDKLYPIITDKSFDEIVNEYNLSKFNDNAPTMIKRGETLNVSDFINTENPNYKFYYKDLNNKQVDILGNTFSIDEIGDFKLYYNDGENYLASLSVMVDDFSQDIMEWINDNNISGYAIEKIDTDKSVVLSSGSIGNGATYTGPNANSLVSQSYIALNGDYKLNDYLVLEFTGKNMPEIAFFAKNYNESMFTQFGDKQGVVVSSGITLYNGQLQNSNFGKNTKVSVSGPYMANILTISGGKSGRFLEDFDSKIARANLQDNIKYRVIMGFEKNPVPMSNGTESLILNICLCDITNNSIVETLSVATWYVFNNTNSNFFSQNVESLSGSIVLYGKFATECKIDKIYPVYVNTDFDDVIVDVNGTNMKYNIVFIDENNVAHTKYVKYGETPIYDGVIPPSTSDDEFTYSYQWDKEIVPVTGNIIYTLVLTKTLKNGYKLNATKYENGKYILEKDENINGANYLGPNNNNVINQSYVAIDGPFGFDDYIAFDFTGKNMPEIAFFANNYNDNMYYADGTKQGIVVSSGVTLYNGGKNTTNPNLTKKVVISGPNMACFLSCDGIYKSGNISDFKESLLARESLEEGVKYRIIMGFTQKSDSVITLKYSLMKIVEGKASIVEESAIDTYGVFNNTDPKFFTMKTGEIPEGSIVLYGKFGVDLVIDKIYGVYENTTIDSIKGLINN